jgi:uncharacterized protein DUF4382
MEDEPMKPIRNELVFAGLALAVGLFAGCSNGSNGLMQGKGAVKITMSASATAPVAPAVAGDGSSTDQTLQTANITFASILARNLDGQLIDVTIALPVTVNVLGLVSGGTLTLPAGFLPPGTYDQLVIVMTKVELTLTNGTVITIDPPGGGWTAVIPVRDTFTVAEGQTTTVNLRFHADGSFRWLNGGWEFHPEFDCDSHQD